MSYIEHIFEREGLDIQRKDRVYLDNSTLNGEDVSGKRKVLGKDISEVFPDKSFVIRGSGNRLCVCVDEEDDFSISELVTLEAVIKNYKDNT